MPRIARIILVLAAVLLTQTDRNAVAQPTSEPSVEKLAKIKLFAFGGVGIVGVRSQGQMEYGYVMSRPNRLELLEQVFESGTPEAKSYALVGFYNLDRSRFNALVSPLRSSTLAVRTASGCIIRQTTLGSVIRAIEAGAYAHYV